MGKDSLSQIFQVEREPQFDFAKCFCVLTFPPSSMTSGSMVVSTKCPTLLFDSYACRYCTDSCVPQLHGIEFHSSLFLLSSDHTEGLHHGWDYGTVYCSEISKRLLLHKFDINPERIVRVLFFCSRVCLFPFAYNYLFRVFLCDLKFLSDHHRSGSDNRNHHECRYPSHLARCCPGQSDRY